MIQLLDSEYNARYVARKRPGRTREKVEPASYHEPVLLAKSIELLAIAPGSCIVDGTLGSGGHSSGFLKAGAEVIALDQDPDAIGYAREKLGNFADSFHAVQANFRDLDLVLNRLGVEKIDAGFLDLGVSSWQLDSAERGFSFMRNGPLDMRMNPETGVTAADIVNNASGEQLERIFRNFGEELSARRLAARIVRDRLRMPFAETFDLVRSIETVIPRRGRIHPATKAFQALRIAVNRELEALPEALVQFAARLKAGGRMGVITFHSLEDRIVKQFFSIRSQPWIDRPEWPAPRRNPECIFRKITSKPVVADEAEQLKNPRSRSAKLRVVEKL
jgi:16S rRNA (cytosine1402-N4)-methyltransferase